MKGERDMQNRPRPLADVPVIYQRYSSQYPDAVLIPMEDGNMVEYHLAVRQPAPITWETEEDTVGYKKDRRMRAGRSEK
jgi:hypothetical protein